MPILFIVLIVAGVIVALSFGGVGFFLPAAFPPPLPLPPPTHSESMLPKTPAEASLSKTVVPQTLPSTIPVQSVDSIKKQVSVAPPLRAGTRGSGELTTSGVFAWTNVRRVQEGVSVILSRNFILDEIASRRAKDMFLKQYFEHISPQGIGASEVAESVSYAYIAIGENIALGNFESDEDLVLAWMNSPGHRANILNRRFTELGIAVEKGMYEGRETWIGVQIFGKPLSLCPSPDPGQKIVIERNRNMIQLLNGQLVGLKVELESLRASDSYSRDEYNEKVEVYNAMVNQINPLSAETKELVLEYNERVRAFNVCAGS